jgi:hypothetical protein
MNEINVYSSLLSLISLTLLIGLFAGIYVKFVSVVTAILSYPTYLAMYGLEFALFRKEFTSRHFLSLNIPKSGMRKRIMNGFASVVTGMWLIPLVISFVDSLTSQAKQITFMVSAIYGHYLPTMVFLIPFSCIAVIYSMSWFSEVDTNSPWEKIENLSVPSLWKKLLEPKK